MCLKQEEKPYGYPIIFRFNSWAIDSDSDGLTDGQEFENATHPNHSDTDGDGMTDLWELTGPAPSDPCGIEGTPPNLSDLQVSTETEWGWVTPGVGLPIPVYVRIRNEIKVTVTATDNVGLDWIRFHIDGKGEETVNFAQSTNNSTATVFFDHSFWSKWVSGYDLNITVSDVNGNEGYMEFHIDSVLEAFVQWLIGQVTALAKFVMELASAAIEWIWDAIQSSMTSILDPIFEGGKSYVINILDSFNNGVSDMHNYDAVQEDTQTEVEDTFFSPFFIAVFTILNILLLILSIIQYFCPILPWLMLAVFVCVIVITTAYFISNMNEDDISSTEGAKENMNEGQWDSDSILSTFSDMILSESMEETRNRDIGMWLDWLLVSVLILKVFIIKKAVQFGKSGVSLFILGFTFFILSGLFTLASKWAPLLYRWNILDEPSDPSESEKSILGYGIFLGFIAAMFYVTSAFYPGANKGPTILWTFAGFLAQCVLTGAQFLYFLCQLRSLPQQNCVFIKKQS